MNSQTQNLFSQQQPKQNKPPQPFKPHDNPVETLRDLGSGVMKSVTQDALKATGQVALDSIFGNPPASGDYAKNPFELGFGLPKKKESPEQARNREILNPQRITQEHAMVKQQIEAVRQELAMLAAELGQLNLEVQKAIHEVPVDPGVYHLNFFERLRGVISMLRKNVRDGNSWLAVGNSKKRQKGFWGMYKKHGTQFGLSADRTPATQTG